MRGKYKFSLARPYAVVLAERASADALNGAGINPEPFSELTDTLSAPWLLLRGAVLVCAPWATAGRNLLFRLGSQNPVPQPFESKW
jgi:hypothetical protein